MRIRFFIPTDCVCVPFLKKMPKRRFSFLAIKQPIHFFRGFRFVQRFILPDTGYRYAVCLREKNALIGYIWLSGDESRDLGYGFHHTFWNRGFATEAGTALIEQAKKDGIPYITATHDLRNLGSGRVMQKLHMTYRYSYVEHWQPKNTEVTFRMYQRNLDGQDERVYQKYWKKYPQHFIERIAKPARPV